MNELGLLYHYLPTELTPPENVWNQLVRVLDDSQPTAFERMETLEIEPPAMAWDNILLTLDESNTLATKTLFKKRVLDAELMPPAFVWDEIEKSLDRETPIKKIGRNVKVIRMAIGVAVAACLVGVVFAVFENTDNRQDTKITEQFATIKNTTTVQPDSTPSKKIDTDSQHPPNLTTNHQKNESLANNVLPLGNLAIDSSREFGLEKYKTTPVPNINTTNNMVASVTRKLKDAFGNILDDIRNYNTSSGYIAAIGPNGNSVNVSTKLAGMIPFFQEDSTTIKNEEYLDQVMRETNVWRQKLKDWQNKVNSADDNPAEMNFIDPIDLLRFFQKNK